MTQPSNNRPLLTFALVSCNQEPFVREAVEAALAQTYSPLEVILSDDCSDDRSFAIMQELAANYRGPHRIVLNRNSVRRKTGGHFNRVAELAQGELIVIAAADDVSLPQRTELMYQAWEKSGRRATSLYSDIIQIDEDGAVIETVYRGEKLCEKGETHEHRVQPLGYVQTLKPTVHGCSHVIAPKLFKVFGDMPEHVIYEDKVLGFRSVLAGKLVYVNEPLVKYRLHGANAHKYVRKSRSDVNLKSLELQESQFKRNLKNNEAMYDAFVLDLERARREGVASGADLEAALGEAKRLHRRSSLMVRFFDSGFAGKCRILLQLRKVGMERGDGRTLVGRLLPDSLALRIRLIRNMLSSPGRQT